jgi:hypothetical protein
MFQIAPGCAVADARGRSLPQELVVSLHQNKANGRKHACDRYPETEEIEPGQNRRLVGMLSISLSCRSGSRHTDLL